MSELLDITRTVLRDHKGVRSIDYGTIWVCSCCMLSHANGECCADDSHGGDGIAPWADVDDRFSVTAGMTFDEHADGCPNGNDETYGREDCDCETIEFSSSRCDGCGSYLAGSRYAHTLWRERRTFARRGVSA